MNKFKSISFVDVFLNGTKIGIIAMRPDNLCAFEYDAKWLEDGFSVSPLALPLKPGVFTAQYEPFEGLFGVFNDSLPDGWGRLLTDRLLRKNGIDPYQLTPIDRLTLTGQNGMGALSYLPQTDMFSSAGTDDLNYLEKEIQKILNEDYSGDMETLVIKNGSSGGARPKAMMKINGEEWLVKFGNSQDPKNIGQIEYAYSLAAKKAGIIMPETKLFDHKYFGVKRFDRLDGNKIHTISAAGLLNANFRAPSLDYKDLIEATLFLTKNIQEAKKIFRLAVFNVLAHNCDDHAKNFSFIYTDDEWHVSPAYDLVFSEGFNSEHSTSVMGQGRPCKADLFNLADATGLDKKEARLIYEEVFEHTKELRKYIKK